MKAIPKASEMALGQIESIADDGHLMRVDEHSWECVESAFAAAYSIGENESQAALDNDEADKIPGEKVATSETDESSPNKDQIPFYSGTWPNTLR